MLVGFWCRNIPWSVEIILKNSNSSQNCKFVRMSLIRQNIDNSSNCAMEFYCKFGIIEEIRNYVINSELFSEFDIFRKIRNCSDEFKIMLTCQATNKSASGAIATANCAHLGHGPLIRGPCLGPLTSCCTMLTVFLRICRGVDEFSAGGLALGRD